MKKVEIYDPAMCCPTGVCGPGVDPNLTRIASAVYSLEQKGVDINVIGDKRGGAHYLCGSRRDFLGGA